MVWAPIYVFIIGTIARATSLAIQQIAIIAECSFPCFMGITSMRRRCCYRSPLLAYVEIYYKT